MLGAISALLLATTLVTASPVQQQKRASVVQLPARAHHGKVFNHEHATLERLKVRAKYSNKAYSSTTGATKRSVSGGETFDIQRRASSGKDALVDVFDSIDELYYGPLTVGTPGTKTTVDFDTGSSDLWLPLSTCSKCPGPTFKTTSSSTYKASSSPFSIQYEDGSSAKGKIATETVTVAGLTVKGQGFGAVTSETGNFLTSPSAGLLGLGFPANAESGKTPFFINLAQNGALAANEFSFYMSRNGGSGSELCIGCTNSAKYTGSISYYDLDNSATNGQDYYWVIDSQGFSYGNGATSGSFSAVIDSGTTLIYIPTAAATKLYKSIPGAKSASSTVGDGFYTFPCNSNLGTINLTFGNTKYAVNPADFNLGPVSEGSSSCVAGIIGEDVGEGLAIIGDEFMKNWYSVFSYDKRAVGFAKAI